MQLVEYLLIYDNAASIIEYQYRNLQGVNQILADLRSRLVHTAGNEVALADLTVEPRIDAQRLNVPQDTAIRVTAFLHKINLLHVWLRVFCPKSVRDGDSSIIVETDDSVVFKNAISDYCLYCGAVHADLKLASMEQFYKINLSGNKDRFRLNKFIKLIEGSNLKKPDVPTNGFLAVICEKIGSWFGGVGGYFSSANASSATETAIRSLQENGKVSTVLDMNRVFDRFTRFFVAIFACGSLLSAFAYVFSVGLAFGVLVATTIILLIYSYYATKVFSAAPFLPKLFIRACFAISTLCVMSSPFDIDLGIGEKIPWHISLKSSSLSLPSATLAVVFALFGLIGYRTSLRPK